MEVFVKQVRQHRFDKYFKIDIELDNERRLQWETYIESFLYIHIDISNNRLTDFDEKLQDTWFQNIKKCLFEDCFSKRDCSWMNNHYFEGDHVIQFSKMKYRLFLLDVLQATQETWLFTNSIKTYLKHFTQCRNSMETKIFDIIGNSPYLIYIWSFADSFRLRNTSLGLYCSHLDATFRGGVIKSQSFKLSDVFPIKLTFLANDVLIRYLKMLYFFFVRVKSIDMDETPNAIEEIFEKLDDLKGLRSINASDVFYYELSNSEKLSGLKKKRSADEGTHVIIIKS